MAKKAKKKDYPIDRSTQLRRMPDVRKVIDARLKAMKKSKLWLANEIGMRPATVYDFFAGRSARLDTLERMFAVLGLEVRPKK